MHEDERERESHACTLCRLLATGGHCSMLWALERLADRAVDRRAHSTRASRRASPPARPSHTHPSPPRRCKGLQRGPSGVAAGGAGGAGRGEPRSAGRRGGGRGEGRTAAGVAGEAEREGREREEATGSMLSCDVRSRTVS